MTMILRIKIRGQGKQHVNVINIGTYADEK